MILFLVLSLSFSESPLTFEDLNDSVKCEAKKCFNPETSRSDQQYGKPPIPDYIGLDIGCINGKMERIESFIQSRSHSSVNMLHKYDTQGRMIFLQSGQHITTLKYDQAGNIIEIREPDMVQKIAYSGKNYTKWTTNEFIFYSKPDGLTISDKKYTKSGKLESTTIKRFDEKKRLISNETIDMNRKDDNFKQLYFYNGKGQLAKKISDFSNFSDTIFMFYNDHGFIVKDSSINGKGQVSIANYTYDIWKTEEGINIRKNRLFKDSSGGPLIYTFDTRGNWIHSKDYAGEILLNEEVRKIYYSPDEKKPVKK